MRFRIWSKYNKQMCYTNILSFAVECFGFHEEPKDEDSVAYLVYERWSDDDLVFMLSTGVKDESEHLVYEGDIIKSGTTKITLPARNFIVIWDEGYCGYVARVIGSQQMNYRLDSLAPIEVLGNVKENPELVDK